MKKTTVNSIMKKIEVRTKKAMNETMQQRKKNYSEIKKDEEQRKALDDIEFANSYINMLYNNMQQKNKKGEIRLCLILLF